MSDESQSENKNVLFKDMNEVGCFLDKIGCVDMLDINPDYTPSKIRKRILKDMAKEETLEFGHLKKIYRKLMKKYYSEDYPEYRISIYLTPKQLNEAYRLFVGKKDQEDISDSEVLVDPSLKTDDKELI